MRSDSVRSLGGKSRVSQWPAPMRRGLALLWAACAASALLQGQPGGGSRQQVQASYVYNFAKFVKWPEMAAANQGDSFTICVMNDDPFGSVLESTLAGQSVNTKPVMIRHLPGLDDVRACHILYVNPTLGEQLPGILASVHQNSVLTVSDMPDFSERGGMIQFVFEGSRLRFKINLDGAESAHLVFPSELLKVAKVVKRPER